MTTEATPGALGSNEGLGVAPRWWHCDTHGPGNHTAWGCPECVREMRCELATLRNALMLAEAALADIGDADREPGDDMAWYERRAARALPAVRAALIPNVAGEALPQAVASTGGLGVTMQIVLV